MKRLHSGLAPTLTDACGVFDALSERTVVSADGGSVHGNVVGGVGGRWRPSWAGACPFHDIDDGGNLSRVFPALLFPQQSNPTMPPRGSPRVGAPASVSTPAAAEDALGPGARLTLRSRGLSDNASSDMSAASSPLTPTSEVHEEKKGKAPERRVLPARIRRAAGGAEGIRELEEMVVDWLERYGTSNWRRWRELTPADCSSGPPKALQITLATLPRALVTPKPFSVEVKTEVDVKPDVKPTQPEAGPSRPRIETPSWIFVRAGEDDKEEAREELAAARARLPHSPTKRLRGGLVGHEVGPSQS